MSGFFGALFRRPVLLVGLVLVGLWLVWIGKALKPRLLSPPIDRSRAILINQMTDTNIVRVKTGDRSEIINRTIGPVTPWKNGLVYWDGAKSCLIYTAPQQKAVEIRLRPLPTLTQMQSLSPAPGGVYLNATVGTNPGVVFVHLPDGTARVVPGVNEIRSGEQSAVYSFRTVKNTLAVRYPDGKTRAVSGKTPVMTTTWDYDAVREAVVWRSDDGKLFYNSPKRAWHKDFGWFDMVSCNPATGEIWIQTQKGFGAEGLYVLSETGQERGWRLRGELPYAMHFSELTPEQETLARALPDHKQK